MSTAGIAFIHSITGFYGQFPNIFLKSWIVFTVRLALWMELWHENPSDFIFDWFLIVPTAKLDAGAFNDTLDLEAQSEEVIWTLAGSLLPTRSNQTEITVGQVMGGAGVFTWETSWLKKKKTLVRAAVHSDKNLQFMCMYCEATATQSSNRETAKTWGSVPAMAQC